MAVCAHCGGETTEGISCLTDPVVVDGRAYAPVRFGQEPGPRHRYEPEECRDCSTPVGGVHHLGCCVERCPACHGQAVSCACVTDREPLSHMRTSAPRCRTHVLRRVGWH
jgi:hypothetical protein